MSETGYPIDLVIPMVFPQDPKWQAEYRRLHGGCPAASHVRWRSWGTEELLVRCCFKYMPWLRCIYLLLAGEGQVQEWMRDRSADAEGTAAGADAKRTVVRVVFHRDFIPEKYLPCFTSPTIEMFLRNIPGLSEHFIYGNDDMFPLSPLSADDFFRGGLPCQHLTEHPFPVRPNLFQRKCLNQQNMIAAPFGKHYTKTWLKNGHSLQPMLLSTCREVWERYGSEIRKYLSPITRTEHSYSQYIYPLYQYYTGKYADHAPWQKYLGAKTTLQELIDAIRDPHAGIVCVNDNEGIHDWQCRSELVRTAIELKLEGS